MASMDLAFRNIWRKKSRSVMVLSLLVISMATMLSVYSSVEGSKDNTEDMIDEYTDTLEELKESSEDDLLGITISSMGGRGMMSGDSSVNITTDVLDEVEELDEVDYVVPVVQKGFGDFENMFGEGGGFRPSMGEGFDPSSIPESDRKSLRDQMGGMMGKMETALDFTLTGVPLYDDRIDDMDILPTTIVEGRSLWDIDVGCALISEELTDFFDADVGDIIEVGDGTLEVVGIYSSSLQNKNVYTSLMDARSLCDYDDDQASELRVVAYNESDVEGLVVVLQEYFSSFRVTSNVEQTARQIEMQTQMTNEQIIGMEQDLVEVENQGSIIVAISAGMAGLIVLFIMLYTVKERTKEIGTMKAIGFTSKAIMFQIVMEGFMIAVISGFIGIFIGYVGSPIITDLIMPDSASGSSSQISIWMMMVGFLFMVFLGSIGSIYPAWVASRKSPVEAMTHE